jgi:hypothetical protein
MDEAMETIREMVAGDVPLEHIEAYIDHELPWLGEEQRAVLWLFAWVGAEPSFVRKNLTTSWE